jgi:REP element-mobilizing transposase RayT
MKKAREPHARRPPRLGFVFQNVRPFYFVTFNTHKRVALLARPEVHDAFRAFCQRAEERNIAVGRYGIMPEHIHLFVAIPPEGLALTQWIQALRSVLGKKLLEFGSSKPHWQEGFFDHVLRSSESYA